MGNDANESKAVKGSKAVKVVEPTNNNNPKIELPKLRAAVGSLPLTIDFGTGKMVGNSEEVRRVKFAELISAYNTTPDKVSALTGQTVANTLRAACGRLVNKIKANAEPTAAQETARVILAVLDGTPPLEYSAYTPGPRGRVAGSAPKVEAFA